MNNDYNKGMDKRTVVFGGSGLVGSHLKADLKPTRAEVDLLNIESIRDFFNTHEFDTIVNCAGNVGGLGKNMGSNLEMFMSNMEMNMNLFKVIIENPGKINKTISFLSTCVFPANVDYPITEDKLQDGPPHFSNSGYAYAKRMGQVMADLMNDVGDYGKVISVIPTNLYGPHDNFSIEDGHVIPSLIGKAFFASHNNLSLDVWGDGSPLREFLYVEDVADIIEIILEKYKSTKPLILSHGQEVPISDAVKEIAKCTGLTEVNYQVDKPNGQHRKPSDPSELLKLIGDYKFTSLSDGIKKSVNFYIENYPNVRK